VAVAMVARTAPYTTPWDMTHASLQQLHFCVAGPYMVRRFRRRGCRRFWVVAFRRQETASPAGFDD